MKRFNIPHPVFVLALIIAVTAAHLKPIFQTESYGDALAATGARIYYGAYLDGDHYSLGDAPWVTQTIDTFEKNAGKPVSILHWGQAWHWTKQAGYSGIGDGYYQKFEASYFEKVRQRGTIPMINWNSWELSAGGSTDQPDYQLIDIINGAHDAYITQWARDAAAWGKPFFLRFNHEMNGDWYPWSEQQNGNNAGEYIQAWRRVHDIFEREGATNVTWVWAVNTEYASNPYSSNLEGLYPGGAYVDWVAVDVYNWGTNPAKPDAWKSFSQLVSQTYNHLLKLAPSKPIMLSEMASSEYGGSKADWLKDALETQIPNIFPQIRAMVWFNKNAYEGSGNMDWVIESSSSSQQAFAAGVASSYYAANNFAGVAASPLKPMDSLPSVRITNLVDGGTVTHNIQFTITAEASDDVGVKKVSFFVNNMLKCSDFVIPYTCTWKVPPGVGRIFTIKANVRDVFLNLTQHAIKVTSVK
ncbi:MAG TPA: Ig-like domain-containing protein [Anaerolineales bacterium]|nr:Ig-like domain-containing protein [Anaerolineales bacterium]